MQYISTDPVALLKAEAALREMGSSDSTSLSCLLLDGPPGTGKTTLAKFLAHRLEARLLQFQFFPGVGREDLILDLQIGTNGTRTPGILLTAMTLSLERKVVLLLDELDKAEPCVDSFLLNFLTEGTLWVPQLGEFTARRENLLVVLTKNDEREASGPLMRRARTVQMRWPTLEVEMMIFRSHFPKITEEACLSLLETAYRLRQHPGVRKAPSTPELIRLYDDLIALVREGVGALIIGLYYIDSIAPLLSDRKHIPDSPTYLGSRLLHAIQEMER